MRKFKVLPAILALLLVLAFPVQQASAAFKDLKENHWATELINDFVDLGVIKGYEDQTFRPDEKVTRKQAAVMLVRVLKLDTENVGTVNYSDVGKDHPSYKEIAAITKAGIMSGYKGKFNPDEPITRKQIASILTEAFDLEGKGTSSFKDVPKSHEAYEIIDALYANNITTGYDDNTFKLDNATTRAHFVAFLDRAMNTDKQSSNEPIVDLLKEVYANEQNLKTYEFEGSMNLGLILPESIASMEDMGMVAEMLKDIQIDISGAYQKDPMQFEATVDVTLKGDIQTTFSMPMVLTEDKMWFKLPESALLPIPEEAKGKFIEFDLEELAELSGQPSSSLDMELQTKFGIDMINIFVELLGKDFYKEIDLSAVEIPEGIEGNKAIKFELTNETLKPFMEILMNELLPELIALFEKPEYAEAVGITAEDIALVKEALASEEINIDEIVTEINKFLKINEFDEYIVIHQNNYISYDKVVFDIDVTVEEETFGFKLTFDQSKSKVNEKVNFPFGIPTSENILPYERLVELEEEALGIEE